MVLKITPGTKFGFCGPFRTASSSSRYLEGLTYWDKEELEMNIPEVQAATRVAMLWQPLIRQGDQ